MARTNRFGLTALGPGESMATDGGRFAFGDRFVIDRLLAAAEAHNHAGGERLANPSGAPSLELFATNGSLRAGTTYFYRVSYLDEYGLETAASAEASVTTPAAPAPPSVPQIVIDGRPGTLPVGTYQYAVTAVVNGKETAVSAPAMATLDEDGAIVVRPIDLPEGATGYFVWRLPMDGQEFMRVNRTAVPAETAEFVDDGLVPWDPCSYLDPSQAPPRESHAASTYTVAVEVPAADHERVRSKSLRWRVYRTTTSGVYGSDSLVAEVALTESETDPTSPRVVRFFDYGDDNVVGTPLEVSQTLTPSRRLRSGAVEHGTGTVETELSRVNGEVVRAHSRLQTVETALTSGGGGGGGGAAMEKGTYVPIWDVLPSGWQFLGVDPMWRWEAATTDLAADGTTYVTQNATWQQMPGRGDYVIHGWSLGVTADSFVEFTLPQGYETGNLHFEVATDVTSEWGQENAGFDVWALKQPREADGSVDFTDSRFLYRRKNDRVGLEAARVSLPAGYRTVLFRYRGFPEAVGSVYLTNINIWSLGVDHAEPFVFYKGTNELLVHNDFVNPSKYVPFYKAFPPPPPTLASPNGSLYQLTVTDDGTLGTRLVRLPLGVSSVVVSHSADRVYLRVTWAFTPDEGGYNPNNFNIKVYDYTSGARGAELSSVSVFGDVRQYDVGRTWRDNTAITMVEVVVEAYSWEVLSSQAVLVDERVV